MRAFDWRGVRDALARTPQMVCRGDGRGLRRKTDPALRALADRLSKRAD